jgi:hypothetical protein
MTRKDYILIAAALKKASERDASEGIPVTYQAAYELATALGRDNPRFDRERFLQAAGVQS